MKKRTKDKKVEQKFEKVTWYLRNDCKLKELSTEHLNKQTIFRLNKHIKHKVTSRIKKREKRPNDMNSEKKDKNNHKIVYFEDLHLRCSFGPSKPIRFFSISFSNQTKQTFLFDCVM